MKFTIWDKVRKRYLSDDELKGMFYYTGMEIETNEGSYEDTEPFEVNLLTGKIKTNHDNSCIYIDCTLCLAMIDDANFELGIDGILELDDESNRAFHSILRGMLDENKKDSKD